MPSVFVRYSEQGLNGAFCILLHGVRAKRFLKNPEKYIEREFDAATLIDFWEVPRPLENVVVSGDVRHVFASIVALDTIAETPVVSDLLATIFEAGYQMGVKSKA